MFLVGVVSIAILKAKVLKPAPMKESAGMIRLILKQGFWLAIVIVASGFVYGGVRLYKTPAHRDSSGPIVQRAGPCSANTAGNGNATTVDCGEKEPTGK